MLVWVANLDKAAAANMLTTSFRVFFMKCSFRSTFARSSIDLAQKVCRQGKRWLCCILHAVDDDHCHHSYDYFVMTIVVVTTDMGPTNKNYIKEHVLIGPVPS